MLGLTNKCAYHQQTGAASETHPRARRTNATRYIHSYHECDTMHVAQEEAETTGQ